MVIADEAHCGDLIDDNQCVGAADDRAKPGIETVAPADFRETTDVVLQAGTDGPVGDKVAIDADHDVSILGSHEAGITGIAGRREPCQPNLG